MVSLIHHLSSSTAQQLASAVEEQTMGDNDSNPPTITAFATLARCSHVLQLKLLVQHAHKPEIMAEATAIAQSLPAAVLNYAREQLDGLPENVVVLAVALCSYRRGIGGRQNGPDPLQDPGISPKKAARILAKRRSAGVSKIKKKLSSLAEEARGQLPRQLCQPQTNAARNTRAVTPEAAPPEGAAHFMSAQPGITKTAAAAAAAFAPSVPGAVSPWQAATAANPAVLQSPPAAAVSGIQEQQIEAALGMLAGFSRAEVQPDRYEPFPASGQSAAVEPMGTSGTRATDPLVMHLKTTLPQQQQLLLQRMQVAFQDSSSNPKRLPPGTATVSASAGTGLPQASHPEVGCSSGGSTSRAVPAAASNGLMAAMQLGQLQQARFGQEGQLLQTLMGTQEQQQQPEAAAVANHGLIYDEEMAAAAASSIHYAAVGIASPAGASSGRFGALNRQVALSGAASSGPEQHGFCPDAAISRLEELRRQHRLLNCIEADSNPGQQAAMINTTINLVDDLLAAFQQKEQQQRQGPQGLGQLEAYSQNGSSHPCHFSAARAMVPDALAGQHDSARVASGKVSAVPQVASGGTADTLCCEPATGVQQQSDSSLSMVLEAIKNLLAACLLQLHQPAPAAAAQAPAVDHNILQHNSLGSSAMPAAAGVSRPAQMPVTAAHNGQAGSQMNAHAQEQQQQQSLEARVPQQQQSSMARLPQRPVQGLQPAADSIGRLSDLHGGSAGAANNDRSVGGAREQLE